MIKVFEDFDFSRVGQLQSLLDSQAGGVLALQVAAIDVCATTIKTMISLGRSPRGMLPGPVLDYINGEGLYQPHPLQSEPNSHSGLD